VDKFNRGYGVASVIRRNRELASAIRQYKKTYKKTNLKKDRGTDVMMEMGDVFSYLFQLSYMLDVDLDKMWVEHGKKMKYKKYNLR
tara:strand:- start:786 stop:1043 length:258 start_codon:yes stop_codon:yes gene_type:complete